ncbi:MAG: beta-glucosidase, partial [Halieaceae bacterium]
SFPRMVGQIPIYYAKKNTGRPPEHHTITHIDEIDGKAAQTSLGMSAFHLDAGFTPLFPFGYGLSYSHFEYEDIATSSDQIALDECIEISATVRNVGAVEAIEVVQLYVRDLVGSVTRPIRELKGFRRVRLQPGQSERVCFSLDKNDLAFYNRQMELATEAGQFHAWIGGNSDAQLWTEFELVER